MGFRYVLVAVIAAVITLFAIQNNGPTSLWFLFWSLEAIPLATVILTSVAAGIVIVGVPLWVERWRLRARARALETRLEAVEALLGERDRAAGAPPASP